MSTALRAIGRQLDDLASLGRALDELLAGRTEPPALLALGEPTHGIEAFPVLRNDILAHLVERGYRSIILETDYFAAAVVDDYVNGADTDLDTVLSTGFSHGFGAIPGNRELLEWLRAANEDRAARDRIHFYGFDAPTEYSGAPSPRQFLTDAIDYLPSAFRPESLPDTDALCGADADWTNQAAMYDAAASIGGSAQAHALRLIADDLVSVLHRAGPTLRPADPGGYDRAFARARTGLALLRYHSAMATPATDRIGTLASHRTEMMADNLLTILARERHRGPSLVFAHNAHLQRARPHPQSGADAPTWGSAGALTALTLGDRYLFVATDANPTADPGTLHHLLAEATTRRALFPVPPLLTALPPAAQSAKPFLPGHIPFGPADLTSADAMIFITDTDGTRHQYW
ncbi:erythromycin esterase family protein [Nocardia sp. NPDC056100]|uniref:erythromycin esterase family protein n=1 Tax=Nocardia sp. NPDC056100 TaxID=3345712 RepID=UPI0035D79870